MISKASDVSAPALHDDHFQAVVMVQVHMGGRQNLAGGVVLGRDQPLRKVRPVVVIDNGDRPYDDFVLVSFFLN